MTRCLVGVCGLLLIAAVASADPPSAKQTIGTEAEITAGIDKHLERVWADKKVRPAASADDAAFFRRASLDITGRIPLPTDVREFLADTRADKRRLWVAELVDRPGYTRHLVNLWRDRLLPPANGPQVKVWRAELDAWLVREFQTETRYDRFARRLLIASLAFDQATTDADAPPTPLPFYRASDLKPENLAAAISRNFLGIQLDCAQCHDHPFAPWTQKQFGEFAAFFTSARPTRLQGGRVIAAVEDNAVRSFKPEKGQPLDARFLDGTTPAWQKDTRPRAALADWVTADTNPYFARHAMNRLWGQMFGADLVTDDDKTFDGLLDELAKAFRTGGYDLRAMTRAVANSRAYELASEGDSPVATFARMRVRGLRADQMEANLARAAGFRDTDHTVLRAEFLGKFQELTDQPSERQVSPLQVLTLMHGGLVDEAVHPDRGRTLKAVLAAPWMKTADRVEALYLATVSRPPTAAEGERHVKWIDAANTDADRRTRTADVFWALLNGSEFLFNH
jgi:hypothetical protein